MNIFNISRIKILTPIFSSFIEIIFSPNTGNEKLT